MAAAAEGVAGQFLVGRDAELGQLAATLGGAARGVASSLLVFGVAGVGKTALVREGLHRADPDMLLLSGTCLPLQSVTVPLLPLRTALRAALPAGHSARLDDIGPTDQALGVLDSWLEETTRSRPVAIAIDDLQWADQSTLDVLMYLLAGPADRPFALVGTIRTHGLPDGHRLHRWLADVLRLPRVTQLRLTGLDRAGTEGQLAALLGGAAPHHSLVDDVFARTGGNPYLTSLIGRSLTPASRRVPENLPADLTSAVRQLWHQLSPNARVLTSLVAVGGRPERPEVLWAVASAAQLGIGDVLQPLQEAVQLGMLEPAADGRYWFHHPLQPQVLEQELTPEQRRRWHAAYARYLESVDGQMSLETAIASAEHHDQAAHLPEAYSWALRSWALADTAQESPELRRLLRRAIDLHPQVPGATESTQELLQRLRRSAEAAGDDVEELGAVDSLLALLDPAEQPLFVAELLVRRMMLRMSTGAGFVELDDVRRAVEISAVEPESWQHAMALAELAHIGLWADSPDAPHRAERALGLARRAGHPRALSSALTAYVMRGVLADRAGTVLQEAADAVAAAAAARDWWIFIHAVLWQSNASFPRFSEAAAGHLRSHREQLVAIGAPQTYVARLSATEAEAWLVIGEWQVCRDRLRVTLGSDPGAFADLKARLTATLLAAWQGRTTEARAHLARAEEMAGNEGFSLVMPFAVVRTILCLETGDAEQAYRIALTAATTSGMHQDMCEWLAPLAGRALADQAQTARDEGRSDVDVLSAVDDLVERLPAILIETGPTDELLRTQWAAMTAWYAAEVARARRAADAGSLWLSAAELAEQGQLAWIEAYAWWRAAEAQLDRGRKGRAAGIDALRRGYELAQRLKAATILARMEALSRMARVPLLPQVAVRTAAAGAVPGLTAREREILDHLVGGSTYAEIAAALVISEKTVSSHVSNLLRKTGTSSRVELSRVVARIGERSPHSRP